MKRTAKMDAINNKIQRLHKIAYDPYERIKHPTPVDWQKSYEALKELCRILPDEGLYPNTLGYLCYYGRHTNGARQYKEARSWFEKGAKLRSIESTYKLADMLASGLGGPADPKYALRMYQFVYEYCRNQFESGVKESKFADAALRIGRIFHEGKLVKKNDLEALGYLLEAKYAIEWRKQYDHYGDDVVEKNIQRLIDECEQPDKEQRDDRYFGIGLGRVPFYLLMNSDYQMTIDIEVADEGVIRLEFRKKRRDEKKPSRILWTATPAMRCFMTDSVVLYGAEVRRIWNRNPGAQVLCDHYKYDETIKAHLFYLEDELQCKLVEGEYVLPMDEFWLTEIRDHPEAECSIVQ